MSPEARVGCGLDVHAFSEDAARPLVLGGVSIPDAPGLQGHSDADVVCHAVADALLGAAAVGDLGSVVGVDDPVREEVASVDLVREVVAILEEAGWRIVNVDCTVVATRPRLAAHRDQMRAGLAAALGTDEETTSVKITSTDGLGAVGRGEGIACWATVLLQRLA